ncbi:MAG: DUF4133 domain-containing protein [Candidatus Amulumruptor caecigallinarius]|nr:DUF4133 domain-containing protein [Candidatus Amulumruptor caecigallinarius]MCM1397345.1 DUF4133 domain-containing protein [Candidatus Amulumruptor caecigallinarius]MCM1453592.1 DUF4133 domain-containing protein [bacterium]
MEGQYGYPVFKGLQKPLEFMGIRGRFLGIAAATIGVTFIVYFALATTVGQATGISVALACLAAGLLTIYVKQKTGLHSKKKYRGIKVYHHLFNH